jgi:hypothetical protein
VRTVEATRYVTPLREGGSMPGLVEADDDGMYVVKFRGAGQGPLALVAELIGGELARAAGLRAPEVVLVELDPVLGQAEPDPEVQDLLRASGGLNAGLDFLPGALPFAAGPVDSGFAARVVWLDALLQNVDRTPRNPNLLRWHGDVWLIDHGAALYRQHAWVDPVGEARRPFATVAQHVLLGDAAPLTDVDAELAARVDAAVDEAVAAVPAEWFVRLPPEAYAGHLHARLAEPRTWVTAAEEARRAA